jgi:hypothetical protein
VAGLGPEQAGPVKKIARDRLTTFSELPIEAADIPSASDQTPQRIRSPDFDK